MQPNPIPIRRHNPPPVTTERRTRSSGRDSAETLQQVLQLASIEEWDLLLVGDGSGTGWNEPNGWACVLVDRVTRLRKQFYGGSNAGSVNFAELMPYLQALAWFHDQHGAERLTRRAPQRVHVITDSQVTVTHGTRAANPHVELPNVPHRALWAAMREQCRAGYQMEFHWAARMTTGFNWLGDLMAGLVRQTMIRVGEESPPDGLADYAQQAVAGLRFCDPKTGEPLGPYSVAPDAESGS